ncbi:MAG: DUF3048 domain-containing protein [Lachnospiraceae bacterium]|nr:DUF3048 domain-containing protein [Lachnospiraceae bacterium]
MMNPPVQQAQVPVPETAAEPAEQVEEVPVAAEIPAGMYVSELTGEPISESIRDQRPVAIMVDNEKLALPHYGTAEADVVYEIMNSTANDRITRLMLIYKDWGNIERLGSIRSTRPTNILLASEWNAVLCHDGGPYYNKQYFDYRDWAEHFSGTFSRIANGKASEFTEYVVRGDLQKNFTSSGYSTTYNQYAPTGAAESHFSFTPYGTAVDLSKKYDTHYTAQYVSLPFKHNKSQLAFNPATGKYEYYEYDIHHLDEEDGEPLAFENVILQGCDFVQLDSNGYLIYDVISTGPAMYIHNGVAVDCAWAKNSETDITRFYDVNGDELMINTGKTYIGLIPLDSWNSVRLE